jgi:hypothetical protein
LDWFLASWIEGTAIPELHAREIRITEKTGVTTVTGVIVQKDVPDDLVTAVPVYGETTGNALVFLGEVLADGRETGFRLTAPSGVRKVARSEADDSDRPEVDSKHISNHRDLGADPSDSRKPPRLCNC